jgi:hypothetical protein
VLDGGVHLVYDGLLLGGEQEAVLVLAGLGGRASFVCRREW